MNRSFFFPICSTCSSLSQATSLDTALKVYKTLFMNKSLGMIIYLSLMGRLRITRRTRQSDKQDIRTLSVLTFIAATAAMLNVSSTLVPTFYRLLLYSCLLSWQYNSEKQAWFISQAFNMISDEGGMRYNKAWDRNKEELESKTKVKIKIKQKEREASPGCYGLGGYQIPRVRNENNR